MYHISRSTLQKTIPFLKKYHPSLALQLRNEFIQNHLPNMGLSISNTEMEMVIDSLYEFQNPIAPSDQALKDQQLTSCLMVDWLSSYSQGE